MNYFHLKMMMMMMMMTVIRKLGLQQIHSTLIYFFNSLPNLPCIQELSGTICSRRMFERWIFLISTLTFIYIVMVICYALESTDRHNIVFASTIDVIFILNNFMLNGFFYGQIQYDTKNVLLYFNFHNQRNITHVVF